MRAQYALLICLALPTACRCAQASPQTSETSRVAESIDVNDHRPLAAALDVLEKKYGWAITYEDSVYSPSDIQDVTPPLVAGPVSGSPRRLFVLKGAAFHFQYATENGKPAEDTLSLLRRMLNEYAKLGNPRFEVQERATKPWPEWHVFPIEARTASGHLVPATALLDNIIYIPNQKRKYTEMLGEIIREVSSVSGCLIMGGYSPDNYFYALRNHEAEYGVDHRPAREALAELLGPSFVWDLSNVPGDQSYFLNIRIKSAVPSTAPLPQRFYPFDAPGHLSDPSHPVSREEAYRHRSRAMLRHWPNSPQRISEIQLALAHAGFYHGQPTGSWDTSTVEAMKAFQSANDLPPTGRWDSASLQKLGVSLIPSAPANAAKPQE